MGAGAAMAPSCETCTHADSRPDSRDWYLCMHIALIGQSWRYSYAQAYASDMLHVP